MNKRALLLSWALLCVPAWALEAPTGAVVLTISGAGVTASNGEAGKARFDMAMLTALPQQSFTTRTPWYRQPRKFTGPLLRDVLAAAGVDLTQAAQGRIIEARALNDYKVEIPLADASKHGVLMARMMDDKPMAVREKGPLFIIYPFDAEPETRNTLHYARSAWQLKALVLK